MNELAMEIRRAEVSERTIVGRAAPYDEVSYLTPDPAGERVLRGAFSRTLRGRETKVPLLRNHTLDLVLGRSTSFDATSSGLVGTFRVYDGGPGDQLLD